MQFFFFAHSVAFTCSSQASVAVNSHLPLLHGKRHHLDNVQNGSQVGHSVVAPAEIVEIDWKIQNSFSPNWATLEIFQEYCSEEHTVVFHKDLWVVWEATFWLQRVSTVGVFTWRLEVDHCFNAVPWEARRERGRENVSTFTSTVAALLCQDSLLPSELIDDLIFLNYFCWGSGHG